MRSAPKLKILMMPTLSVAILNKLALLKTAYCNSPLFNKGVCGWPSALPEAVIADGLEMGKLLISFGIVSLSFYVNWSECSHDRRFKSHNTHLIFLWWSTGFNAKLVSVGRYDVKFPSSVSKVHLATYVLIYHIAWSMMHMDISFTPTKETLYLSYLRRAIYVLKTPIKFQYFPNGRTIKKSKMRSSIRCVFHYNPILFCWELL